MEIRNLTAVTDTQLHEAFLSAFSDYEIKIDMPFEKFKSITYAKDYLPKLSVGSFEGDELTGFILLGYRLINGVKTVYDIATGVTSGHRGTGVGSLLLKELLQRLKKSDISRFYLEVLENNTAAKHLYDKFGFTVCRRLACYEAERDAITLDTAANCSFDIGSDSAVLKKANPFYYNSYNLTWQNTVDTWSNSEAEHDLITLKDGGKLAAYGIIHRAGGSVLQFGLHPDHRDDKTADFLLKLLIERTDAEIIRFINLEEGCRLCSYLEDSGFKNHVNQFEMIYDFQLGNK